MFSAVFMMNQGLEVEFRLDLVQISEDCHEEIAIGSSGYCQCGGAEEKLRARAVSCDHRSFTCATECLQAERYRCKGWRQTGGCSADGASSLS